MALDTWTDPDDIYYARGEEVSSARPLFTGDVFGSVSIRGIGGEGLAIVISHPCSIRGPSGRLSNRITMAEVTVHDNVPAHRWRTGYYDRMPLPDLADATFHVASFSEVGTVDAAVLEAGTRLACLSQIGVNMLQQRLVWHLTRFEVPTHKFEEAFAHTWHEAALLEEWNEEAAVAGLEIAESTAEFDVFIRSPVAPSNPASASLQDWLRDPQSRSTVRIRMRSEIQSRFHPNGPASH